MFWSTEILIQKKSRHINLTLQYTHIRCIRIRVIFIHDFVDPVNRHAHSHAEHDSPYDPQELRPSFAGVADAQNGGIWAEVSGRVPDGWPQCHPAAYASAYASTYTSASSFGAGVVLKETN